MSISELSVKLLRKGAVLPRRATAGSAGYDLCACLEEDLLLPQGGIVSVPTGVAIALPDPGHVALVFGRSGLGIKHGVAPANGVGVIDSDYRGEILVGLKNSGPADVWLHPGDRIAQLLVMPVETPVLRQVEELDETGRGAGGFGSTGRL